MAKIKFDAEKEYELPEGFDNLEAFVAKFAELNGQLPTLQTTASQFEEFKKVWGDPGTLKDRLNEHIKQQIAAAVAAAKAEGATKKEQAAVADDIWTQWESLTPQQQAQAMVQQVSTGMQKKLDEMVAAKWTEAQTALGTATANNDQRFDLLARALDAKLANPKLNVSDVWKRMGDISQMKPEQLFALAMEGATAKETWEGRIAEEKAKWKEEADKEAAAARLKVLNSETLGSFRKPRDETPSLKKDGEDALRNHILSKALANGTITEGQI